MESRIRPFFFWLNLVCRSQTSWDRYVARNSGQIIVASHDLTPKGSFWEGKSPYFREIQVGEIL